MAKRKKTPLERDLKLDGYVLEWRAVDREDKTPVKPVLYGEVAIAIRSKKPPGAPVVYKGMRLVKIARAAHTAALVDGYNEAREMLLCGAGPLLRGAQEERLDDGQTDMLCRLFHGGDFLRANTQWHVGIDFVSISILEIEALLKCGAIEYCPAEFGRPAYRLAMSGRNALVRWGEIEGLATCTVRREVRTEGGKVMQDWAR